MRGVGDSCNSSILVALRTIHDLDRAEPLDRFKTAATIPARIGISLFFRLYPLSATSSEPKKCRLCGNGTKMAGEERVGAIATVSIHPRGSPE
jgi:hypothetical protein